MCIEVKGEETRDLFASQHREKPEHKTPIKQTWDYMGAGNFEYGIATNYRQFVLIDKAQGYARHHLFDFLDIRVDKSKLKQFIAVFSRGNILEGSFIPSLYRESQVEERAFTTEFYQLFHRIRLRLIGEFEAAGGTSKEDALHYAQLILNRLVFVFFASGTGKLKRRLFAESILKSLHPDLVSEYSHYACDTILNLFQSLDKGSKSPTEIFGFNGGLFREAVPPNLTFRDLVGPSESNQPIWSAIQHQHAKLDEEAAKIIATFKGKLNPIIQDLLILSSFDFQSEVNVNILGHIFEQSLNDLEHLAGSAGDSRRKREGIYYTPPFVTEYICKNTIVKALSKSGTSDIDQLVAEHSGDIDVLEDKFRRLKIVDPACGSGAFLLKAVDVLLEIHKKIRLLKETEGRYLTELRKRKRGTVPQYWALDKWNEEDEAREIIEKNIFGVDLNRESVEITRLSLFLKVATTNRKLFDLSKNIREGNSLVSDGSVAGSKAFDWPAQFPDILAAGGFDVVLGNPPYVRVQRLEHSEVDYLLANFAKSAFKKFDLSVPFFEKAMQLVSKNGRIGFISSSQWMNTDYGEKLREYLSQGFIEQIVSFDSLPVFPEASTYPAIFLLRPIRAESIEFKEVVRKEDLTLLGVESARPRSIPVASLGSKSWSVSKFNLVEHLRTHNIPFEPITAYGKFCIGALTGADYAFVVDRESIDALKLESRFLFPYAYRGEEVWAYVPIKPRASIIYPYKPGEAGAPVLLTEEELKTEAPNIYHFLERNRERLQTRKDSRKLYAAGEKWFRFLRPGNFQYIAGAKLVIRGIAKGSVVGSLFPGTAFNGANTPAYVPGADGPELPVLLAILNSKVVSQYLRSICPHKLQGYFRLNSNSLNTIPIPKLAKSVENELSAASVKLTALKEEAGETRARLLRRVEEAQGAVPDLKLLAAIDELDTRGFLSALAGSKRSLPPKEADEWEEYFSDWRKASSESAAEIGDLEVQVEALVSKAYGNSPGGPVAKPGG